MKGRSAGPYRSRRGWATCRGRLPRSAVPVCARSRAHADISGISRLCEIVCAGMAMYDGSNARDVGFIDITGCTVQKKRCRKLNSRTIATTTAAPRRPPRAWNGDGWPTCRRSGGGWPRRPRPRQRSPRRRRPASRARATTSAVACSSTPSRARAAVAVLRPPPAPRERPPRERTGHEPEFFARARAMSAMLIQTRHSTSRAVASLRTRRGAARGG